MPGSGKAKQRKMASKARHKLNVKNKREEKKKKKEKKKSTQEGI